MPPAHRIELLGSGLPFRSTKPSILPNGCQHTSISHNVFTSNWTLFKFKSDTLIFMPDFSNQTEFIPS